MSLKRKEVARFRPFVATLCLLALAAGCDETPTGPTHRNPPRLDFPLHRLP